MSAWRFYQGLRGEWRWYHLDHGGNVYAESDQGFAELRGCMANAESAGFTGQAYQVHARQSGNFAGESNPERGMADLRNAIAHADAADEQPSR